MDLAKTTADLVDAAQQRATPMEYLVVPAQGSAGRTHLLGLTLEDRARKMLGAAGVQPAADAAGPGDLVLYPAELAGPPKFGKELAALRPAVGAVLAGSPAGAVRPVLVLGAEARARLMRPGLSVESAWERAAEAVTARGELQGPAVSVVDPISWARGKAMLLRSLRKSIDGLVSRTLNRPVSIAVSSLVADTPLTPNHLSIITFAIAVAAAWMMAVGTGPWFVLGALTMHVSSVLDGCDGEIARLKYQSSRLGAWLDTIFDDVSNNLFSLATGIGVYRWYLVNRPADGTWGGWMLALALAGFVLALPAVSMNYVRMIQSGASDSGGLEWGTDGDASPVRRFIVTYLAPLVKRDAYLFVFLLLAIAQIPSLIVILYFTGAVISSATMVSDAEARRDVVGFVTAWRARRLAARAARRAEEARLADEAANRDR